MGEPVQGVHEAGDASRYAPLVAPALRTKGPSGQLGIPDQTKGELLRPRLTPLEVGDSDRKTRPKGRQQPLLQDISRRRLGVLADAKYYPPGRFDCDAAKTARGPTSARSGKASSRASSRRCRSSCHPAMFQARRSSPARRDGRSGRPRRWRGSPAAPASRTRRPCPAAHRAGRSPRSSGPSL